MAANPHDETLSALVDAIVPGDDYPSASAAGALRLLERLTRENGAAFGERLRGTLDAVDAAATARFGSPFATLDSGTRQSVLDEFAPDPEYRWFAQLVSAGYYANPQSGSNDGAASWRMLDYDPAPAAGWTTQPFATIQPSALVDPGALRPHYDAIVIGSGAGGGVAARVLAEAGRTVLVVERGSAPSSEELWRDHLHSRRAEIGLDSPSGPPSRDNARIVELPGGGEQDVLPPDVRWGNNAMTLGGGTRVYGAQAWRFAPQDFRMASTYGVPEGSALADWPFGYDELEPWYTVAEWELGVSGSATGDPWAGARSMDYPMPPLPSTLSMRTLQVGASALGFSTTRVPLLVNSRPYAGRPGCDRCAACVGFACPVDAKASSLNTSLRAAAATGRCSLLLEARVTRLLTDGHGRVVAVAVAGASGDAVWHAEVSADEVVVAAGATETARLLLASTSDREPNGIGNNADQVGRHLQGHLYAGALGVFADEVQDDLGPGVSIATCDFRHGNPGYVGGAMIADEFVPTPINVYGYLASAGIIPPHGIEAKNGMRALRKRIQRIVGPVHEVTSADSRVLIDPRRVDRFGMPLVRLAGASHHEDFRMQEFMTDRAVEWLRASGATQVARTGERRERDYGPSSGTHQAGTARMGTDPASSVTDPWGRVWGHDNLLVADASLHVTNGGVNPVLTILANSYRIMDHLVGGRSALSSHPSSKE